MSKILKSCPFCGNEAMLMTHEEEDMLYYATCSVCPVRTFYMRSAKNAIKAWNTRANSKEVK